MAARTVYKYSILAGHARHLARLRRAALPQQLQLPDRRLASGGTGRACAAPGLQRAGHHRRMLAVGGGEGAHRSQALRSAPRHRCRDAPDRATGRRSAGRCPIDRRPAGRCSFNRGRRSTRRRAQGRRHAPSRRRRRHATGDPGSDTSGLRQPLRLDQPRAPAQPEGPLPRSPQRCRRPRPQGTHARRPARLPGAARARRQPAVRGGVRSGDVAQDVVRRPRLDRARTAAARARLGPHRHRAAGERGHRRADRGGGRRADACALAQAAAGHARRHARQPAARAVRLAPRAQCRAAPAFAPSPAGALRAGLARADGGAGRALQLLARRVAL